jgi:hypothetical protein
LPFTEPGGANESGWNNHAPEMFHSTHRLAVVTGGVGMHGGWTQGGGSDMLDYDAVADNHAGVNGGQRFGPGELSGSTDGRGSLPPMLDNVARDLRRISSCRFNLVVVRTSAIRQHALP